MVTNACTVVDIGSSNIKIIEASLLANEAVNISKFSVLPFDAGIMNTDSIPELEAVAGRISSEINREKYLKENGVVLIANSKVISREIILPVMPLKAIKNTIKFEAPQYFPVNLTNYLFDYKILQQIDTPEGGKYRINIVAVPSEIIDFYVSVMDKSGIRLQIVDVNSNTLYKFASMEHKKRTTGNTGKESYAVLEIGAQLSHILFVSGDSFMLERSLNTFNGNSLTDVFSKYLQMNYSQAEDEKIKNGEKYMQIEEDEELDDSQIYASGKTLSDSEQLYRIMRREVQKVLDDFIDELSNILEFYYSRGVGSLSTIYLTGGGAMINGLDRFLVQNLNIDVNVLNRLKCVVNSSGKDIDSYSMFLANVIGGVRDISEKR